MKDYYRFSYFDEDDILNLIDSRLIELTDEYVCVEDLNTHEIIKVNTDHIYSMGSLGNGTIYYAEKRY